MRGSHKLLSLLISAALAVCLCVTAGYIYDAHFVFFCGGLHRRDAVQLDLQGAKLSRLESVDRFLALELLDLRNTGLTSAQYDGLKQQLPDCQILWDVPFQGQFLSQDLEILTLTSLTEEEVDLLDHLPKLLFIDARECEEYELLQLLQQRHPNCHVIYSVTIGDRDWDLRETDLVLEDISAQALQELLPFLPQVERIRLQGELPGLEELRALQEEHPQICITWETELCGTVLSSSDRELDLRDASVESAAALATILAWYPDLDHVDMRRL